jgi:taurine dioxygenase
VSSIRTQPIEAVPVGETLGAEIRGVDLADGVCEAARDAIKAAWAEYLVLVLRDQQLSDAALIDFARQFGELDLPGPNPYGEPLHKAHPELNVISNIVEKNRPIGNLGAGEAVWHADMTYLEHPPRGAVLYAVEIPPEGGNTYFANMYAAYDALPEALRARAEGRVAIHDASHNSAGMRRKGYQEIVDVRETPGARHPLIRTDAASGRRALFLGRRPRSYVLRLEVEDSEALLDALWAHATEERFTLCHEWRIGDVLMWNNLAVLHRRDAFDPDARRRLHRAQIKGDQPIA